MKGFILVLAAALTLAAGQAYAAQGGEGSNTGCNGQGNPNSPCTGTTNNGGQGGSASSKSKNVNTNKNTNKNTNTNVGINEQYQGQTQGNANAIRIEGDKAPEIPVSSAYAPGLTSGIQTCLGSTSVGGQGPMVGISFGTTWRDQDCVRRLNADALYRMGLQLRDPRLLDAAVYLLSDNADVAKALKRAGLDVSESEKRESATPDHIGFKKEEPQS